MHRVRLLASLFLLACPASMVGQSGRGTILGSVTDSSGVNGIQLGVGQRTCVDVVLQVEELTQQIAVAASAVKLQTEATNVKGG